MHGRIWAREVLESADGSVLRLRGGRTPSYNPARISKLPLMIPGTARVRVPRSPGGSPLTDAQTRRFS
eukprot:1130207-Rhodomonas_salina.2